jgi:hypothetical protein
MEVNFYGLDAIRNSWHTRPTGPYFGLNTPLESCAALLLLPRDIASDQENDVLRVAMEQSFEIAELNLRAMHQLMCGATRQVRWSA